MVFFKQGPRWTALSSSCTLSWWWLWALRRIFQFYIIEGGVLFKVYIVYILFALRTGKALGAAAHFTSLRSAVWHSCAGAFP